MKSLRLFALGALLWSALVALNPAFAQGTAFTYQGRLTVSNNPANGNYDFTFKLFDADVAGTQTGSTITSTAVGVTNGLFVVLLDFGAVYNTTTYWLELAVRTNGGASYTTVTPRQELTPTPYAVTAENVTGSVSASQIVSPLVGSSPTPLFQVDQGGTGAALVGAYTSPSGTSAGVQGMTASTSGSATAIYGVVSSTSPGGFSAGVYGQNNGTGGDGIGVYGSQAGSGWGVYGYTPSGLGVLGYSSSSRGVYGESDSGTGLYGSHDAGTGTAAGAEGDTASTDSSAMGVYGVVESGSPGSYSAGVRGQNNGTNGLGIGVYGSQAGSGWGVYGTAVSGTGVYADGGTGYGVQSYGDTGIYSLGYTGDGIDSYSFDAIGVYGIHDSDNGTPAGVEGDTYSTNDNSYGVYGIAQSQSSGFTVAVRGQNNSTNYSGAGVYGSHAGGGIGVYGTAVSGIGVYAYGGAGTGLDAFGDEGIYTVGYTYDGIDSYSDGDNGIGVYGIHDSGNGTAAGLEGDTYSTNSSAYAVYGVVESASPGVDSTAVRGQNNGAGGLGIGVWGSQNGSGWGVYGYAPSGIGVYGNSSSGTGVYASSASGSALTVGSGAIHVSGAGVGTGTAAFIQVATTANSFGSPAYITTISNPLCDGDPNAILIATHNYNPTSAYETHPFSVWYDGTHWTIYHDDITDIVGEAFNVLVIKN
jgi:hypothetical protein